MVGFEESCGEFGQDGRCVGQLTIMEERKGDVDYLIALFRDKAVD